MGTCKWCGIETESMAKSHIIPQAFWNYDGKTDKKLFCNTDYAKRSPIGSYDDDILCLKCETDFNYIDSQASDILLKNFEKNLIPFNDKRDEVALQISGRYRDKIKRFLIYTLWRASVSNRDEFKGVNLGPYEDIIRTKILENASFSPHEFGFLASKVAKPSGQFMPLKRYKRDFSGRNYYLVMLSDYTFDIKVDSQNAPKPYDAFVEYENVPFIKMEESPQKLKEAMRETLLEYNRRFKK